MKVWKVLLVLSCLAVNAGRVHGQVNCPTTATTGALVCEVPIAIATSATSNGVTSAATSASAASVAINASVAAQLTQLPVPSGTAGTVILQVKGNEVGVPYNNLGPILIDRPDTVGSGRLYLGFSYQHFSFNSIDGNSLRALPFAYQFSSPPQYGFGGQVSHVGFRLDQFVALATYGASRTTDVSVIVPINSVHLNSATTGVNYTATNCSATSTSCTYLPASNSTSIVGSASGVGDLVFSVKQLISGREGNRTAVAVGGSFRAPTGDQNNYLGSGAYGFNLFGLVSYRAKFSPHLKLSNQWNGPSPLVNTVSPNTDGQKNLPGGVQYDVGVDASIIRRLTASVDVLGSQFINTTSLKLGQLTLSPVPSSASTAPASIPTVTPFNNSYTTANVSAGIKFKPIKDLLIYANVLYQFNNVGLRSDAVPLIGISYSVPLHR